MARVNTLLLSVSVYFYFFKMLHACCKFSCVFLQSYCKGALQQIIFCNYNSGIVEYTFFLFTLYHLQIQKSSHQIFFPNLPFHLGTHIFLEYKDWNDFTNCNHACSYVVTMYHTIFFLSSFLCFFLSFRHIYCNPLE